MIAAMVLSGGASRRMGRPKALLTIDGEAFVARIVRVLREAGLVEIVLVTGVHHDAIAAAVDEGVRVVRNTAPDADQLSSLRLGLDTLRERPSLDAVLVALVDHPLIDPDTVRAMCRRFGETAAPVVRPVCDGRHGHPVLFARETFDLLRQGALPDGAKGVVRAFAAREVLVPTTNPGVLADVDTPADYRAVGDSAAGPATPSARQAEPEPEPDTSGRRRSNTRWKA